MSNYAKSRPTALLSFMLFWYLFANSANWCSIGLSMSRTRPKVQLSTSKSIVVENVACCQLIYRLYAPLLFPFTPRIALFPHMTTCLLLKWYHNHMFQDRCYAMDNAFDVQRCIQCDWKNAAGSVEETWQQPMFALMHRSIYHID